MSSPLSSENSCSRLSPHITFGTISIRDIVSQLNTKHNDSDMRRLQRVAHPNVNKIENYEKYLNEAEKKYLKNHQNGWIEKHKDAWDILKK